MPSLIIRISHNGHSQDYLFHQPGPIVIGPGPNCDLRIHGAHLDLKVLEVKLSGAKIFVKEVGPHSKVFLDEHILPYREETLYEEGQYLTLDQADYQIQIQQQEEAGTLAPPPFFEDEFKERLGQLDLQLQDKQTQIHNLENKYQAKREQLSDLSGKFEKFITDKSRLEREISLLKVEKKSTDHEHRKMRAKKNEAERLKMEQEGLIKKLETQHTSLQADIFGQKSLQTKLSEEIETRKKELELQDKRYTDLAAKIQQQESILQELQKEEQDRLLEIQREKERIHEVLVKAESMEKEKSKNQTAIAQIIKEKFVMNLELEELRSERLKLNGQNVKARQQLQETQHHIAENETIKTGIMAIIQDLKAEESHLNTLRSDLLENIKGLEDKLTHKKVLLGQLEWEEQDASKKLLNLNLDFERRNATLKELMNEENKLELKITSSKDELQRFIKKSYEEQVQLTQTLSQEKSVLTHERDFLTGQIEDAKKVQQQLELEKLSVETQLAELKAKILILIQEKHGLEKAVSALESEQQSIQSGVAQLKNETHRIQQDKEQMQRQYHQAQQKLVECEELIKDMEIKAKIEIENFKNEERHKLHAEKELLLLEIEVSKQKSLVEIESKMHRHQDEIHEFKIAAQQTAAEIIADAYQKESALTIEAHERTHKAEALLQQAKAEGRELKEKTEAEITAELAMRKTRIKEYLNKKQQTALKNIEQSLSQNQERLKKNEGKFLLRLEEIKRKEMKKIACLRDEELASHQQRKQDLNKEMRLEREKMIRMNQELKQRQEAELSEKKRSVIEHLNQDKFQQLQTLDEELTSKRELFENTKNERLFNATTAVMNVLVTEKMLDPGAEKEAYLKEKFHETLQMAIDGQNVQAMKKVEQILDSNPLKRKKIWPMLQKFTLHFVIPAVLVLVVVSDVGQVRTQLTKLFEKLLQQKHSAAEVYVKKQQEDLRKKNTFSPPTTPEYKGSYTDNILYTTGFETVMANEAFQNEWILNVHDFLVKEMELSEDVAINFISAEGTLMKDLEGAKKEIHPQYLDQGIQKLRTLEQRHMGQVNQVLTETKKMPQFLKFRKEFYEKYAQAQSKKSR